MIKKHLVLLTATVFLCLNFFQSCFADDAVDKFLKANKVGFEGIQLFNEGKLDDGIALLKQATEADPDSPLWHMNYGNVLFRKGQLLFEAGNKDEAEDIFSEVEDELSEAIELFEDRDDISKSHCYFLLGDIYQYVHSDNDAAKEYYQLSLKYHPENQDAATELKKLE